MVSKGLIWRQFRPNHFDLIGEDDTFIVFWDNAQVFYFVKTDTPNALI